MSTTEENQQTCEHNYGPRFMHDHTLADICTKCGHIKKQGGVEENQYKDHPIGSVFETTLGFKVVVREKEIGVQSCDCCSLRGSSICAKMNCMACDRGDDSPVYFERINDE